MVDLVCVASHAPRTGRDRGDTSIRSSAGMLRRRRSESGELERPHDGGMGSRPNIAALQQEVDDLRSKQERNYAKRDDHKHQAEMLENHMETLLSQVGDGSATVDFADELDRVEIQKILCAANLCTVESDIKRDRTSLLKKRAVLRKLSDAKRSDFPNPLSSSTAPLELDFHVSDALGETITVKIKRLVDGALVYHISKIDRPYDDGVCAVVERVSESNRLTYGERQTTDLLMLLEHCINARLDLLSLTVRRRIAMVGEDIDARLQRLGVTYEITEAAEACDTSRRIIRSSQEPVPQPLLKLASQVDTRSASADETQLPLGSRDFARPHVNAGNFALPAQELASRLRAFTWEERDTIAKRIEEITDKLRDSTLTSEQAVALIEDRTALESAIPLQAVSNAEIELSAPELATKLAGMTREGRHAYEIHIEAIADRMHKDKVFAEHRASSTEDINYTAKKTSQEVHGEMPSEAKVVSYLRDEPYRHPATANTTLGDFDTVLVHERAQANFQIGIGLPRSKILAIPIIKQDPTYRAPTPTQRKIKEHQIELAQTGEMRRNYIEQVAQLNIVVTELSGGTKQVGLLQELTNQRESLMDLIAELAGCMYDLEARISSLDELPPPSADRSAQMDIQDEMDAMSANVHPRANGAGSVVDDDDEHESPLQGVLDRVLDAHDEHASCFPHHRSKDRRIGTQIGVVTHQTRPCMEARLQTALAMETEFMLGDDNHEDSVGDGERMDCDAVDDAIEHHEAMTFLEQEEDEERAASVDSWDMCD